ncbi:type I glyceraldehyde-3-phosphate dehydrogenase [Chengkuizengella sp. YPA3-1-1]|uniref:Type I glyceraldehyde-3-phosphate dehydrogenase n=2 Tax=Chengkuizengella marina TaxID=2507566 RepID=A0A6N9Q597_9BACL|nr:type I glyceraldehyde-3-phosphate dehydrogenase [Chengkuizengella marina]NBI29921.1 type I glyceraldehyde-3-phosphate dehydrogenase [Chengkuizengella marina]
MIMIGINGMGRIGRLVLRKAFDSNLSLNDPRVVAINSKYSIETVSHLIKYDTVHGKFDGSVEIEDGDLIINGFRVKVTYEMYPENIPWEKLGVKVVIDSTGQFNNRESAQKHLQSGAETVINTAPAKDMDLTVVMGVNDHLYDPESHKLLSSASCTTNCVAPILDVLDKAFSIKNGWVTSVHSYTNDQKHLDNPHHDLRRARACTQSIIPTSTGVGKALKNVIPHLAPIIQGLSVRVPTPDVSLIDMTIQVHDDVTLEKVQKLFEGASRGHLSSYLDYINDPLISSDFIGNEKSAVIDGLSLSVAGDQIKVLAWYDNEWGYSCRVVDLAHLVINKQKQGECELWDKTVI